MHSIWTAASAPIPRPKMFVAYGSDNEALGELGVLLAKAYSDAEYLGGLVAISELD